MHKQPGRARLSEGRKSETAIANDGGGKVNKTADGNGARAQQGTISVILNFRVNEWSHLPQICDQLENQHAG